MNKERYPFFAMVALAIWMTIAPFLTQPILSPAFEYISDERVSDKVVIFHPYLRTLCQGIPQPLTFPFHIKINRAPATIHLDDQLRNDYTNKTALGSIVPYPESSYTRPVELTTTLSITIPATVPTGLYSYIVVATSEASESVGFEVPFSIKDCTP